MRIMKAILVLFMMSWLVFPFTIKGMVTEQMYDGSLGTPIADAKISAYLNGTLITTATSGSDGKFSLDIGDNIGRYRITAEKEGYMDGGIDGLDVKGDYTMFDDDLTMARIEFSSVHGVVKCGGEPEEGVTINAVSSFYNKTTTTDSNGQFDLSLPKTISYNITAEKYGCLPGGVTGVYAHNTTLNINLAVDESTYVSPEDKNKSSDENQSVNQSTEQDNYVDNDVNDNNRNGNGNTVNNNSILLIGGIVIVIVLVAVYFIFKKRK
ncbi:carboxypeptidase regulatory-like domain-containing protein [Candidatus Micrarchaeota archaeon]|nr:carboxypeptidase regulatory-like domain-containing protein [Candidatus Micrarchaeota archaeon]